MGMPWDVRNNPEVEARLKGGESSAPFTQQLQVVAAEDKPRLFQVKGCQVVQ